VLPTTALDTERPLETEGQPQEDVKFCSTESYVIEELKPPAFGSQPAQGDTPYGDLLHTEV
jgi:hypothetical protein